MYEPATNSPENDNQPVQGNPAETTEPAVPTKETPEELEQLENGNVRTGSVAPVDSAPKQTEQVQ